MRFRTLPLLCVLTAVACLCVSVAIAQDAKDYVPKPGEFPPPNSGQYMAGELVMVDPINRRGGLRLDGDRNLDKYDKADALRFSMLPYGAIWYHGAPAELRDVPIGTHLHGYFYLPPEGDKSIPPPLGPPQYVPKQNHPISLEDDFSFYQRRGQAWKVVSIDLKAGKLQVVSIGTAAADGLNGERSFDIDRSTRVWKGRESAELEAIAPEQIVQVNATWAPEWPIRQFHCADIWLDKASLDVATERQRQAHVRYQHNHWLPGWVDHVKHEDGGHGSVTLTLFGGMDPTLYDDIRAKAKTTGFSVAVAEKTLRTYNHSSDSRGGPVLELKEIANPPLGSSGIQLHVQIHGELLEGYRPGRIIRVAPHDWPRIVLPAEERAKSRDD